MQDDSLQEVLTKYGCMTLYVVFSQLSEASTGISCEAF